MFILKFPENIAPRARAAGVAAVNKQEVYDISDGVKIHAVKKIKAFFPFFQKSGLAEQRQVEGQRVFGYFKLPAYIARAKPARAIIYQQFKHLKP
jgi:hypothetical protein